jgi:hypothetical protein
MDNEVELKKIIAIFAPFVYTKIKLNIQIEDKYIATEFKEDFASKICKNWPDSDCTYIHNEMFNSLVTGQDILKILK